MEKQNINIVDFDLFYDVVKTLTKMTDGVQFSINECGLTVYSKNEYAKCEMTTNSVNADKPVEFCLNSISQFLKTLTTFKNKYKDDYSSISFSFESPFVWIRSGKIELKLGTIDKDKIEGSIAKPVKTELTPMIEFTTSSDIIKDINSHSFLFPVVGDARIYLSTIDHMQNNTMFATIGKEDNELANSITLELGLVNSGSMNDRKVILDFNRLNILNMVQSDEIKVFIANERPVLVTKVERHGKNGSYFNLNIYSFMLVR